MAQNRIVAERSINAPAERVYRYLADYREHHPRILPPAFSDFRVEEGGVGAGTVIRFRVTAGGLVRSYYQLVAEPAPGRVLIEAGIESSEATTFTVTPDGDRCRVRIVTTWEGAGGVGGFIERLLAPRLLGPLYADELARLDRYAQE